MSSIRREAVAGGGSSVIERLETVGDVVQACRIGDPVVPSKDGAWLLRVLVVDDNQDCADSLSRLLQLWGHDIQTAYNGATALEMMGSRQPDVALVDLAMPEMDGCQLARRLRKQRRFNHTLLIAVIGYADQVHSLHCDETGFDHCLFKPMDLADLETLLLGQRNRLAPFSARVSKNE